MEPDIAWPLLGLMTGITIALFIVWVRVVWEMTDLKYKHRKEVIFLESLLDVDVRIVLHLIHRLKLNGEIVDLTQLIAEITLEMEEERDEQVDNEESTGKERASAVRLPKAVDEPE